MIPNNGQSTVNMLGDPMIPNNGQSAINTLGDPVIPHLEDAASVHDCWESPQPNNISKKPPSPDNHGPLATLTPQTDDSNPWSAGHP